MTATTTRHIGLGSTLACAIVAILLFGGAARPAPPSGLELLTGMDLDRNGTVEPGEFEAFLAHGPDGAAQAAKAERLFHHLDEDGDGHLSARELAAMPPPPR